MGSIKFAIAALLLIFVCGAATAAGGMTGYREVAELKIGGGYVRVLATEPWDDPPSCTGGSTSSMVVVPESVASYSEILSAILAAKITGTQIAFYVSGCTTENGNQYPQGSFIYLN